MVLGRLWSLLGWNLGPCMSLGSTRLAQEGLTCSVRVNMVWTTRIQSWQLGWGGEGGGQERREKAAVSRAPSCLSTWSPGFQTHRIKCDRSTGIIEMVMDRFTVEDEGTYTVQLQDGKAKTQSSLVLIGDGQQLVGISVGPEWPGQALPLTLLLSAAFKTVLAEAELQRKEFLRKQGGLISAASPQPRGSPWSCLAPAQGSETSEFPVISGHMGSPSYSPYSLLW